ncbi:activating transcription factor 7-interacting protein 2 isoform X2 [Kryptolebias marmoratus]|uniref:activating transcription factor 7-interacting protein 2 isoform X2 n=1 Tax=Kryptolebias marmoratus TaxID=37003 RepID=UPI0018ACFD1D|nr:activating transcription factor 7-interacting protein 2 isoform X2 [Kryptolebias marmoratus]
MEAVEDETQGGVSEPARAKVSLSGKHKKARHSKRQQTSNPRSLDSRVAIGSAFNRWRALKKKAGMKSDAAVALYLLNAKDQVPTSGSSGANNQKIKISQSEVQALIKEEVRKEMAKSEAKMRRIVEALQQINNDATFEDSFRDLETQLNTVARRAEAALAHIKTQKRSLPSLPGNEDSSRGASGEDCMETLSQSNEKEMGRECVSKTAEVVQMMETTMTELKKVRADNEDLSEMKLPPHLNAFGSSEETACIKALKQELEDNQEEENFDRKLHLPEEPQVKKFKEDCESLGNSVSSSDDRQDLLIYPALPAAPFPSELTFKAALYSVPQKVELKLALIRNPTRLSVLWNVMEEEPFPPPMHSYIIFLTMEKVKGSGIFPKWTSYDKLKATTLPMGALIKKYKPGHRVCAAVIGKDIFGRYGPYSDVVTKTMPD